jgi:hypothetical protein
VRYFINGMFLQAGEGIGLRTVPGEGTVAVFETRTRGYIFNGLISLRRGDPYWRGWILDNFGYAELSNVVVVGGGVELRFTKTYQGRQDQIHYAFGKVSDTEKALMGGYEGVDSGRGVAWCVLTEVREYLFDESTIKSLASQQPRREMVILSDEERADWQQYGRCTGQMQCGDLPRINSTVKLCRADGTPFTTAYLIDHEMVAGVLGGGTRVTVCKETKKLN